MTTILPLEKCVLRERLAEWNSIHRKTARGTAFNQPTNLRASNEATPFRANIRWNSGAEAHPFIWKEGTRQSSTFRRTSASESEITKNRACQRSRPFLPEIAGSRQRERSPSPHFTASRARRERFRRREKARSKEKVAFRRRGSHVSTVDRNRR